MDARQRFIQYVEFVAQNEEVGTILDIEGRHLSVAEFYNLDVIALISLLLIGVLWSAYRVGKFALFMLLRRFVKIKND
jgi:hypothetical protein